MMKMYVYQVADGGTGIVKAISEDEARYTVAKSYSGDTDMFEDGGYLPEDVDILSVLEFNKDGIAEIADFLERD